MGHGLIAAMGLFVVYALIVLPKQAFGPEHSESKIGETKGADSWRSRP